MKKRLRKKVLHDPFHPLHVVAMIDQERRSVRIASADCDAELLAAAEDSLGDRGKAVRWMTRPNLALGGETPSTVGATESGRAEVRRILGRIEHGIPG